MARHNIFFINYLVSSALWGSVQALLRAGSARDAQSTGNRTSSTITEPHETPPQNMNAPGVSSSPQTDVTNLKD